MAGRPVNVTIHPGGRPTIHLLVEMLRRPVESTPYTSDEYRRALKRRGIVASMSRKGDCWDNAVAESFWATIKGEMIEHETYATHAAAIAAIEDYIDGFYNPCRRHSSIGYATPIEFELKAQIAALAA